MTDEERAGVVLMLAQQHDTIFVSKRALCDAVASQIRAAVAAEREACAKVVDWYIKGNSEAGKASTAEYLSHVAADIRKRATNEPN